MKLDLVYNSTNVSDTPIVGSFRSIESQLVKVYYSVRSDGRDEGIEVYFYKSFKDAEGGHFYTSRRYTPGSIPKKYQSVFEELKSYLPKINELPGDLESKAPVKADIEALVN